MVDPSFSHIPKRGSTSKRQFETLRECSRISILICSAFFFAFSGWSGGKPASANLARFSIIFVIAMDIEFLVGVLLYFGGSPASRTAFVRHGALMLLAVVCAHVGGAVSRKGRTDAMKYRGAAIAYTISLLLLLLGIPR